MAGTTEEQMEMFRKSFPTSDEEMDSGAWFFADECPAGAVWVLKGEGKMVRIITIGHEVC